MHNRHALACLLAATIALLSACGGSGGDGSGATNGSFRQPPPVLVQDFFPTGARTDVRADNYFPMGAGDTWTYDRIQNGSTTANDARRAVIVGPDAAGHLTLRETVAGSSEDIGYRVNENGVFLTDPFGSSAPPGVRQIIGTLIEYPQPFYAAGELRLSIRQGPWDEDMDSDGHPEGFRFEFRQVFQGFEARSLPAGTALTAHFTTTVSLTLTPSSFANSAVTVVATEESWFAPGIGLVRSERSSSNVPGSSFVPYALAISGGNVAGRALFSTQMDGSSRTIQLLHSGLVYDRINNLYYASIPGSVAAIGNSIATIDPRTGEVSYSRPVGSDPGPMAVSADGRALYVGLMGAGQVVKLELPSMSVLGSVQLPTHTFYGQLYAESLSVSPVDADVLVVSLYRKGISPRHSGVALIRKLVLQPTITSDLFGSNLLVFGPTGTEVFGFNNETSEFGLRRFAVLADGLSEQQVVQGASVYGIRTIDTTGSNVVLWQRVYRMSDLALLGTVAAPGGGCRTLTVPNRLVCIDSGFGASELRLSVVDATTFVIQSTPLVTATQPIARIADLVPGPVGQVAIREFDGYFDVSAARLRLFTSAFLQ